jgi:hypothetical protein
MMVSAIIDGEAWIAGYRFLSSAGGGTLIEIVSRQQNRRSLRSG